MPDPRRTRLAVEPLEDRAVPAVITVTGTGDTVARDRVVTLREAITAANTRRAVGDVPAPGAGPVVIRFAIPGSGAHTISPKSPLPPLRGKITLDATTEPGYAGTPLVRLDGSAAGAKADGLVLLGGGNVVRGLSVQRFKGNGIVVGSDGNTVAGSWVGLDATGYRKAGNGGAGVLVTGAGNTVGGTRPADKMVVGGNTGAGIDISGERADRNRVAGSFVGTDATGFASVPNGSGLVIRGGADDNRVGGTDRAARNVLTGNTADQLRISGSGTTGNVVEGNHIGIDATGEAASQQGGDAVRVEAGATRNRVGGDVLGAGNLIGGMGLWPAKGRPPGAGVVLDGRGTAGNTVQGNWVGLTARGLAPVTDRGGGIVIRGATGNTVGGSGRAKNVVGDGGNSAGLAKSNNILPANWYFDTIRYIGRPDRLGGSFRA
ncbi:MAG: hypothetical protein K2X82_33695 [Gemmataceae bacterium]|nr:hypothetical protein [Gemmataceae bacterium]